MSLTKLIVGITGDYVPFSYYAAGKLMGIEIDLAREVSNDLGKEIIFHEFKWPDLSALMEGDQVHVIMSGLTITPSRQNQGRFTPPYLRNQTVALGMPGRVSISTTIPVRERFRNLRIAVNTGGYLENWLRTETDDVIIVPISKNLLLPEVLIDAEADIIMSDQLEALHFCKLPGIEIIDRLEFQEHAAFVPTAHASLYADIAEALHNVHASSRFRTIAKKHRVPDNMLI